MLKSVKVKFNQQHKINVQCKHVIKFILLKDDL